MVFSEWKYAKLRPKRGSFAAARREYHRKVKEKARKAKRYKVKVLDLSGDPVNFRKRLTSIPTEVFQIKELEVLNLRRNLLTTIPEEIGELTGLTSLNLGYNQLTTLPESLSRLKNLSRLYLHANQFILLPNVIEHLENLRELYVYDNHLITVPDWIGTLKNLVILDLDSNRLNRLPETITKLEQLVSLNIGHNKLVNLPTSLGEMTRLSFFYFDANRFTKVPEPVYHLNSLKVIWLNDNGIRDIDSEIGKLDQLKIIRLDNNPLRQVPPAEIVSRGANAIKRYLDHTRPETGNEVQPYPVTTINTERNDRVRKASIIKDHTLPPSPTSTNQTGKYAEKSTTPDINPKQHSVLISYISSNEVDTLVERLEKAFDRQNVTVIRSGHDLRYAGSLTEFMKSGPQGKGIIIIMNQGYFYSDLCMLDLSRVIANEDFKGHFFPVLMNDVQMDDTFELNQRYLFWSQKILQLYRAMKEVTTRERMVLQEEIKRYKEIRDSIQEVGKRLQNMYMKQGGELLADTVLVEFIDKVIQIF